MPRTQRPHPFALALSLLVALAGLAAAALDVFPQLQTTHRVLALASAFLPYALIAWLVALAIMVAATRGRSRWLAAPLVLAVIAYATVLLPYVWPPDRAPAGTRPTLRLMSLNMHYGEADLTQLLANVKRARPDLLVLTEFTEQAAPVLDLPEWKRLFPYHTGTIGQEADEPGGWGDASGTQVLSRTPVTELARTDGTRATSMAVKASVGDRSFVLIAAHPANMLSEGLHGWLSESSDLIDLARRYTPGPLVIAGDLNSVPEHVTVTNLLAATGLHECLTGWQPTYPANRLVPLIRIDHVLASADFATVSTSTFAATGSDHLGVVAELAQS